ncbi:hypothetical protein Tco_1006784 [Tanacetum coccineum]|uniref:Uncharacterized protein n=1 Tax=Tanacetum coccineum TaxID=301880 RepID=A0ABQ5FIU7_9ASTR
MSKRYDMMGIWTKDGQTYDGESFKKLKNFVEGHWTVRFRGNDHFGPIMGYGDYVIGDSVISRVYYVEGLGHNLFSVGLHLKLPSPNHGWASSFKTTENFGTINDLARKDLVRGLPRLKFEKIIFAQPVNLEKARSSSHKTKI